MTENSLVATVLSSTTTLLPVQTTTTTTTNKIGITVLTVPAGKEQCRLPLLDHNEEQHDDNNNNGVDRLTTTTNVLHSTVTKTISTVVSAEDEQENHNLRDLGLSEVIANLRLNDNNSDDNAEKQTYHNQRFAAPDGNATGYNADELRLINQYCTLAPINNFHSRYVGQDPSGLAIGHQQPSAWYHDGSGGDHESSGFYSAGGSAAGGFSADCSPPLSGSAPGGGGSGTNHSGPLDYDTNFDDDFDQQLLKATDPSLPGGRNVTESVEVPSSEHVAEIVGRQGCKIKALRAKTNTYIKTPVRGEDPVFVVTGRLEDVLDAKREIECAAEHFTQIRASRRHSQGGQPAPGHITAYVRVPLRVVGLVVGPKGATIKRIQQDTHTYIITPSREREPVFEVTGLVQNVDMARREIEQHIYQRTGNMPITNTNTSLSQYDLDAVVAQHVHTVNGVGQPAVNRPNYGALAAGSAVATTVSDSYADYQRKQQQQQWQALDCQTTTYGGSAAYANGAALSLDGFHNTGSASNQRKALFTQSCPVSAATQQHSQSNIFSGYGGPPAPRHVADDSNWGFNDQSYQPWSDIDLGFPNNFLSNNKINNNNNDYFSTSETLSALAIGGPCGLTSVNSTSRDEGLGDSPINSLGKQHGDMFTQRSFSIWSTQIESIGLAIGVGHREKLAAGGGAPTPQTQFATA